MAQIKTELVTLDPTDPFDAALIPIVQTNRRKRADSYPVTRARGLCGCGCGRLTKGHAFFAKGHNSVQDPEVRLYDYLLLSDDLYDGTPCFLWTGPRTPAGYGFFTVRGEKQYTHRWAYKRWIGPIPEGHLVDHECHNNSLCSGGDECLHRACWNPRHLDAVTDAVNKERGMSPAAVNNRKTHCVNNHEFTAENTYVTKRGRECRTCKRYRYQQFMARRRSDA